jgi:hypothetical protein
MNTLPGIALAALLAASFAGAAADDRQLTQQKLDADCEAARERKLAPEREKFVDECVRDKLKDSREQCKLFYSDYGARSGTRAPLYYDLPECVKAFKYRESYRQ